MHYMHMYAYILYPVWVINVHVCTTSSVRYLTRHTVQIDSSNTLKTNLRSCHTARLHKYVVDCSPVRRSTVAFYSVWCTSTPVFRKQYWSTYTWFKYCINATTVLEYYIVLRIECYYSTTIPVLALRLRL